MNTEVTDDGGRGHGGEDVMDLGAQILQVSLVSEDDTVLARSLFGLIIPNASVCSCLVEASITVQTNAFFL